MNIIDIGRSGERGSGISVLPARYDDDDDIYIYIYINTNFVEHNRHFLSTYFLVDPFVLLYCFYRIRQKFFVILTDNTIILEHQKNKQKLQILEALYIRNMQPTLNRINFQTRANVLICL